MVDIKTLKPGDRVKEISGLERELWVDGITHAYIKCRTVRSNSSALILFLPEEIENLK